MEFINKSRWDTRDLLKLLRECFRRLNEDIRKFKIVVLDGDFDVRGYASYRAKWIKLCLPTREHVIGSDGRLKALDLTELSWGHAVRIAQVAMHEVGHTRGLRHRDMIPPKDIPCDWAEEFVVRAERPRPKPTIWKRVRRLLKISLKKSYRSKG